MKLKNVIKKIPRPLLQLSAKRLLFRNRTYLKTGDTLKAVNLRKKLLKSGYSKNSDIIVDLDWLIHRHINGAIRWNNFLDKIKKENNGILPPREKLQAMFDDHVKNKNRYDY